MIKYGETTPAERQEIPGACPATGRSASVCLDQSHRGCWARKFYPETAPLLDEGWTVDSAVDHVQGICNRALCTGDHADAPAWWE